MSHCQRQSGSCFNRIVGAALSLCIFALACGIRNQFGGLISPRRRFALLLEML